MKQRDDISGDHRRSAALVASDCNHHQVQSNEDSDENDDDQEMEKLKDMMALLTKQFNKLSAKKKVGYQRSNKFQRSGPGSSSVSTMSAPDKS